MDKEESISRWHVDTERKDKLLSVSGTDLDPHRIENVVQQAGFKAEIIWVVGIGGKDLKIDSRNCWDFLDLLTIRSAYHLKPSRHYRIVSTFF